MAINIKNERVCDMMQRASQLTGQSQVSVLETALARYLAEVQSAQEKATDRVLEVLATVDRSVTDDDRAAIRQDMRDLYDDAGQPA